MVLKLLQQGLKGFVTHPQVPGVAFSIAALKNTSIGRESTQPWSYERGRASVQSIGRTTHRQHAAWPHPSCIGDQGTNSHNKTLAAPAVAKRVIM